ncbi:hypothetical protein ACET3Z_016355 [Daucus carota]
MKLTRKEKVASGGDILKSGKIGTIIHNIEITRGRGGQLVRAADAVAKLIAKKGKSTTLKLPFWEGPFDIQKLLSNGRTSGECWGEPEKFE